MSEVLRSSEYELCPGSIVGKELRAARGQQRQLLQMFVVLELREKLRFELGPGAAGDDRHSDHTEQGAEELRHLRIERRLARGKRAVQIKTISRFITELHRLSTEVRPTPVVQSQANRLHLSAETRMLRRRQERATRRRQGLGYIRANCSTSIARCTGRPSVRSRAVDGLACLQIGASHEMRRPPF